MKILWFVGCIGYAVHILAQLDKPPFLGMDQNSWVLFSLVAAAAYAVAGVRALFIKSVPDWF